MKLLRSPIKWFGGKGSMVSKLLTFVSQHHIYCEVFGGGASLLFAKQPAPVEVYNDLDSGLVGFFRVLRDTEQFAEFHRLVQFTPYSREEYHYARTHWREEADQVKRAHLWFIAARQSFGGMFGKGWGFVVSSSCRGMSGAVSSWLSNIDRLPAVHDRLRVVQIEQEDFRKVISRYDTPGTFFYVDPPYVASTRRAGGYAHEMTDDDHEVLLDLCLKAEGMILISGYANEIYESLERNGWKRVDFQTVCMAAGRTRRSRLKGKGSALKYQPRTDSLWLNPALQRALNQDSSE